MLRDLANLPAVAEGIDWVEPPLAADAAAPLVVCGLWLTGAGAEAPEVLRRRSLAGRATIIVPRFQAGNLAEVLRAPAAVEVTPGSFERFTLDGQTFPLPGVSYFQTPLHAGRWGMAEGLGTVVLAYRPHAGAGWIVLCSAAAASRPVGDTRDAQRALWQRILVRATAGAARTSGPDAGMTQTDRPATVEDFLRKEGEAGASILLAWLAAGKREPAALERAARSRLGLVIGEANIARVLGQLPEAEPDQVRVALQRRGWGAHLRRIDRQRDEGATG
jgi:hypothetical protein